MKIIRRDQYLDKLIGLQGTPDIKVITGVRRSGKSKLMDSYIEYLREQPEDYNIIYIDMQSLDNEELTDYRKLNDYVKSQKKEKDINGNPIDTYRIIK